MLVSHRRRRMAHLSGAPSRPSPVARGVIKLLILLAVLYLAGKWTLKLFGFGNYVSPMPAIVRMEPRSNVTAVLEEGESRRAEDGMRIFPEETIQTAAASTVGLRFFDDTWVRLDEKGEMTVVESARGSKTSSLHVSLTQGSLWIATASPAQFSGSIVREVSTPSLTFSLPPKTEAMISASSLIVYRSSGLGVTVSPKSGTPVVIGEGQKLTLPADGTIGPDLYAYRSPLDPLTAISPFLQASRTLIAAAGQPVTASGTQTEVLTVSEPQDGTTVGGGTVRVSGRAAGFVSQVLVNGYGVALDPQNKTFTQQVSLPESTADFVVTVRALDSDRNVLSEVRRTVKRGVVTLGLPTITSPAKTGETYRTLEEEIILRGTSPQGATGMMINDYVLQLFDPAKGTWSYLATTSLGNLKQGSNTYDVRAVFADGRKSDPVRLTILLEAGQEGVVSTAPTPTISASSAPSIPVLNNAPLTPGILSVTSPASTLDGSPPIVPVTNTGFLLEGRTAATTNTIWVNDYRLQLYVPGRTLWNYLADPRLGTVKRGRNAYRIVARNDKGEVLDRLEYEVVFGE